MVLAGYLLLCYRATDVPYIIKMTTLIRNG